MSVHFHYHCSPRIVISQLDYHSLLSGLPASKFSPIYSAFSILSQRVLSKIQIWLCHSCMSSLSQLYFMAFPNPYLLHWVSFGFLDTSWILVSKPLHVLLFPLLGGLFPFSSPGYYASFRFLILWFIRNTYLVFAHSFGSQLPKPLELPKYWEW